MRGGVTKRDRGQPTGFGPLKGGGANLTVQKDGSAATELTTPWPEDPASNDWQTQLSKASLPSGAKTVPAIKQGEAGAEEPAQVGKARRIAGRVVEECIDAKRIVPKGKQTFAKRILTDRSFLKTLTWRVVASTDTALLGWLVTGDPLNALTIAGGEVFTKMLLYFLHEKAWNRVAPEAKSPPSH